MRPGGEQAYPAYIIVDGHSMVFGWPELADTHRDSPLAARERLVRRLTTLQDMTGQQVVVVFDGQGMKTEAEAEADGVQVFYSAGATTADQVIERLTSKYVGGRRITVASRDRAVLDTCSAFGAEVMSANALKDEVEEAERRLAERLR